MMGGGNRDNLVKGFKLQLYDEKGLRIGVKLFFTKGHVNLTVAFKRPNVVLGLYKWKYSLTVK